MGLEFLLITKQNINRNTFPDKVFYKEKLGCSVFDIDIDFHFAIDFFNICLNEGIDDVREILKFGIKNNGFDHGQDFKRCLDLITDLNMSDFIIEFTADFGDWPSDDEYSMTFKDFKVQRDCILAQDERCNDTDFNGYKLLEIDPEVGFK